MGSRSVSASSQEGTQAFDGAVTVEVRWRVSKASADGPQQVPADEVGESDLSLSPASPENPIPDSTVQPGAQQTSQLKFSRAQRLSRAPDIEFVKRAGKRVKSGLLDVRVTASPSSCARVGIIVPKYGHVIVERNRLRRRVREIVRVRMLPALRSVPPTDVLVRALPRAYSASFEVLEREIDGIVARIS